MSFDERCCLDADLSNSPTINERRHGFDLGKRFKVEEGVNSEVNLCANPITVADRGGKLRVLVCREAEVDHPYAVHHETHLGIHTVSRTLKPLNRLDIRIAGLQRMLIEFQRKGDFLPAMKVAIVSVLNNPSAKTDA